MLNTLDTLDKRLYLKAAWLNSSERGLRLLFGLYSHLLCGAWFEWPGFLMVRILMGLVVLSVTSMMIDPF
jgi:hypothetical protein